MQLCQKYTSVNTNAKTSYSKVECHGKTAALQRCAVGRRAAKKMGAAAGYGVTHGAGEKAASGKPEPMGTVTALEAVPKEYEDASLSLGATPVETYFSVSVPAAKSGIAAAVVLGVGRAIGEAMAVMMVCGNVANMPSLLSSVRFLTTGVAIEMNYAAPGSLQRQALFSIGLVLFLFIMLINALLTLVLKGGREARS